MKPVIKICGMREPENTGAIAALGPDLLGFIFYEKSPRYVGATFRLTNAVASHQRVGVFVNESPGRIAQLRALHGLSWIQLHGQEPVAHVRIGHEAGWQIIKAFSVDAAFDFCVTKAYAPFCRYFLFDTKGADPGGNGRVFDWQVLQHYRGSVPFLLSGGLGPELLDSIRSFSHPLLAGYDFNSAVECAPGLKSVDLVQKVINELTPTQ